MTAVAEERDAYRAGFERFAAARAASDPAWLRERRTAAVARFVEKGLPTARDEAWRHTPVAPLVRPRFEPADPAAAPSASLLEAVPGGELAGPRLVFVNGRLSRDLSSTGPLPAGLEVASLRDLLRDRPERLEPWLGRVAAGEASAFADLNAAFAEDGAVVIVAPGKVVREPVLVAHVGAGDGAPTVAYLRTLVLAGPGSECRVVESYSSPDPGASLVNAVTEVVVGDNAVVDRVKLQREGRERLHVATLAARLGRDARFADHSLALGAALSRNDIDVRFEAPGGECALHGLFVLDGRRVADTHSRIEHKEPHCASRQHYKGIVDDQARGVFNGLVVVRPGAQKTDAWQMNQNLLLSRQALVHSTPQLEIRADDVKCKHGSTTGQLDPTALFDLRSRGLSEAAARSLLTWAFASDLLRKVEVLPVRRIVEQHLQAHLPGVADLEEALS
ncbi:MAG TPA: Fe-S cluster assembly protein SufD [Vicinamibacteria bacterium]